LIFLVSFESPIFPLKKTFIIFAGVAVPPERSPEEAARFEAKRARWEADVINLLRREGFKLDMGPNGKLNFSPA